jgi:DNA helicase II / ATP-dependent DNA helicase PcrA
MQWPNNKVILASAGSGKTARLVNFALANPSLRTLFTTYTLENVAQIRDYIVQRCGCIPPNITLQSWYSFLLNDGVRPYQRSICPGGRIGALLFDEIPLTATRVPRLNGARYYLTAKRAIYRDRVADFVWHANLKSDGALIRRLERMYDHILIDEVQDLAGFDLDILDLLFLAQTAVTCVGDPRQATYSTNNGQRNKQFRGAAFANWLTIKTRALMLDVELLNRCHRSNQLICDFADKLYEDLPRTISEATTVTGHDGIFHVARQDVTSYVAKYQPVVLRHSRSADTLSLRAINFGAAKGRTYDRVLIFPTKPILRYLDDGDAARLKDPAKLYVAITRARHSVAFVRA